MIYIMKDRKEIENILNLKRHQGLIVFTILNYIDKGISFVLPLIILYICNDINSYNDLEYAYSIANILVWFFAIGSSYSFYAYKIVEDRKEFLSFFVFVKDFAVVVTTLFLMVLSIVFCQSKELNLFFVLNILITARTINSLYINYYNNYSRLIDKPSKVLVYSIIISIITLAFTVLGYMIDSNVLVAFSLPQLFIPLFLSSKFFDRKRFKLYFNRLKCYYKNAFYYSWPIIVNCFIGVGITNFGKIFAYNYMSESDMYVFSYTMRISLVIQLAHASIISYYSKRVFLGDFNMKIAIAYILYLFGASLMCIVLIIFSNLLTNYYLPLNIVTLIIISYNIFFCSASFMEQFYGRVNKNKYILFYSLLASVFFVFFILIIKDKSIMSISMIMLLFAIIRLLLLGGGLLKMKV